MLGVTPCPRAVRGMDGLPSYYAAPVVEHRWSPYADNHGSVVAVAGDDFAVIASDTRLSSGYSILSRDQTKLFPLTGGTVLGSTGCWADILTFTRLVEARMTIYKHTHDSDMSTAAFAQLVSTMLYGRRFFPYYVSNILAGLDENGRGVVYSYDPVGHVEKHTYRAGGSSVSLLQPLLDNQVGKKNMPTVEKKAPTLQEATDLVHDLFISAAEREIHTGDGIIFKIITKDGITEKAVALRRD